MTPLKMLLVGAFAASIVVAYVHFQADQAREGECARLRAEAETALPHLRLSAMARNGLLLTGRLSNESGIAIDGAVFIDAEALDCRAGACRVLDKASYAVEGLRVPPGEAREFRAYSVGPGLRGAHPRGKMAYRFTLRGVNRGQAGCFS